MTQVVLLHSALGLTEDVKEWADGLRGQGHEVHVPDLFDGDTFDSIDAGVDRVDSLGMVGHLERARELTAGVEGPRVYIGFSFGGALAQILALQEPDAVAAVVLHGAMSPAWFDITTWPTRLRMQLHYMSDDEWVEQDEVAALRALAPAGAIDEFTYPGESHLYAFANFDDYDEQASELTFERIAEFLDGF
ncbi:dienelactone hydrolase family protein [Demequina aurantiaca]|uniref:dienelactone hydrolase family protein n=1 Tax=Demequina aurantiaca TaxID=676200 RepID=UPI000781A563|nr:alpha/beta fold hydrolase [Demequina aurantiaca]